MFFDHSPAAVQFHGESDLPLYHPCLLEVKFRSEMQRPEALGLGMLTTDASGAIMLTRAAAGALPGMGSMLAFERSGLIRRVIPLAEPVAAGPHDAWPAEAMRGAMAAGETPVLAALASSMRNTDDDPNAGASIVELFNDQDVDVLQAELAHDPLVESVSRVPVRYLIAKKAAKKKVAATKKAKPKGAVPMAAAPMPGSMWNLARIRWAQARQLTGFKDAGNIKVAVLDTGIEPEHPDLAGMVAGYGFAHPTNPNASSARDIIGHGTHVAGTIAAKINNFIGINGICTCKLHAFKIFDDIPDWNSSRLLFQYFVDPVMYSRALARCISLRVNVINLSIGGRGAPSSQESALFNRLLQLGVTIVAAMGNENSSIPSFPAAIPGVIAVGATTINDTRATFSNFGPHISVCAPGVGIWSTLPTYAGNSGFPPRSTFPPQPDFSRPLLRDTDYASWQGTSMASPHVAAAAALLLANKGALTPVQVKQRLEGSAVKVPAMQNQDFSQEYGFGRLDLVRLLT